MEDTEKQGDVKQSAVDIMQSYVVDRFESAERDDDSAESGVLIQIDRTEAIRVQLEKFKRDLSTSVQQSPMLVKTLQNMELLERDVGKLAYQLRQVRAKIIEESAALKNKENQAKEKNEQLKVEMKQTFAQLEEMDRARAKLEQSIKAMAESANKKESQDDSLLTQNLRLEISELASKVESMQQEISSLRREVERRDQVIYEKNQNIASLNEELDSLLNKVDDTTQAQVRDRLSVALIDRGSDDEREEEENDPNYAPFPADSDPDNLKKKYLVKVNEGLKSELVGMKESLEKANQFIEQLKGEIADLKRKPGEEDGRESVGGFGLDPKVLDMRSSEMFNVFKEIKKLAEMTDESPDFDKFEQIRESVRNIQQIRESAIQQQARDSLTESYNPYMDENSPTGQEGFGRPSDPFEDLAKAEAAEKNASLADSVSKQEFDKMRDDLSKEADKRVEEVSRQLSTLRNEMASRDIQISKLREKNLSIETELGARVEERNNLIAKIDHLESELVKIKVTPADKEPEKTESEQLDTIQFKKEIHILSNKLELAKAEMEFYKRAALRLDPSLSLRSSDTSTEHSIHPGHSDAHHHDPSHYYPTRQSEESRNSLNRSQDITKSKEATAATMQSKMEKMEANLQSLAASTFENRPKVQKDEKTVALNRLNKEYAMVKANLDKLKQKLDEAHKEHEQLEADIKHADAIKSEEKVIVALEERLATCVNHKETIKKEYAASVMIEEQLKKDIAEIVKSIESDEAKAEITPVLKSALHLSKIVIEEKGHAPLSQLPAAKPPGQALDTSHLQPPTETPAKVSSDGFQGNTIPLASALKVPTTAPPVVKKDIEAIRIKDNKQINEKLSRFVSCRKVSHHEGSATADCCNYH